VTTSSTLLDRIEWILRTKKISARELSIRAGLNPSHLGTLMHRLRGRPDARVESATLFALAAGGGVNPLWLEQGTGTPDQATELPAHPNLQKTLDRLGEERRISRETAALMIAMGKESPWDLEPETWALMALDLERQARSRR
jgi:hypothetical protein